MRWLRQVTRRLLRDSRSASCPLHALELTHYSVFPAPSCVASPSRSLFLPTRYYCMLCFLKFFNPKFGRLFVSTYVCVFSPQHNATTGLRSLILPRVVVPLTIGLISAHDHAFDLGKKTSARVVTFYKPCSISAADLFALGDQPRALFGKSGGRGLCI